MNSFFNNLNLRIVRYTIGLVYLISGLFKAFDTSAFARNIAEYGVENSQYFAFLIVGLEILIGLCWILDIYSKINSHFTFWMTAAFTVIMIFGKMNHGIEDCGCMGEVVKIPFGVSIARNVIIMIVCLLIILKVEFSKTTPLLTRYFFLFVFSCLAFGVAGLSSGLDLYTKHNLSVGQRVEETFLAQFKGKISGKRAFVFVFSPSCSHCWNASENVKSIKQYPELGEVIGVISEDTDAVNYIDATKPNFEIFTVKTDSLKVNIKGVPLLVEFRDGKVAVIHQSGHIPSGAYLKQFSK